MKHFIKLLSNFSSLPISIIKFKFSLFTFFSDTRNVYVTYGGYGGAGTAAEGFGGGREFGEVYGTFFNGYVGEFGPSEGEDGVAGYACEDCAIV